MGRIIFLLSLVLLGGCTWFKPDTVYVPTYVPIVCDEGQEPAPLTMFPVKWQIATNEKGLYVLGLDGENYSNLSINIANIKAYIQNQRLLINYYEQCMERHNKKGAE